MIGNQLSVIKRGANGPSTALQDVSIDHGGFDIFVSKQFLHRANIIAVLEQLGREGMPDYGELSITVILMPPIYWKLE